MARDVKIWKDYGAFKLRACGIIEKDGKYLISDDPNADFVCFPGGHVHIGENTDDAVIRETAEETEIQTKIIKLLAVEQLFFKRDDNMPFHEICYYYLLAPIKDIKTENFSIEENDNGEIKHHKFLWVEKKDLNNYNIKPKSIINILENNLERQHLIRYDN